MSLDKAIEHGKEHRKQYRRAKRWSASCRNHGGCIFCQSNRFMKRARIEKEIEKISKEDVDN